MVFVSLWFWRNFGPENYSWYGIDAYLIEYSWTQGLVSSHMNDSNLLLHFFLYGLSTYNKHGRKLYGEHSTTDYSRMYFICST